MIYYKEHTETLEGALHMVWVRGLATGKGIYFLGIGTKNGINFHIFGITNGSDCQDFGMNYKVGYAFRKVGFQKIGTRNGYVFEASMAGPRPKSGRMHLPGQSNTCFAQYQMMFSLALRPSFVNSLLDLLVPKCLLISKNSRNPQVEFHF